MPLWIKDNDTIVTRAMMSAWQWQGHLCIDNWDNTIIMRATHTIVTTTKVPGHQWQWRHHNKGNDASLTTSNKGNNTSSTTAETPVHWQWQQCHCDKSNNCHCNKGKDICALAANTITMRATMPAWQQVTRVTMLAQQWRRRLCINNGNKVTTTMVMTPVHQWRQQCHCYKGNKASLTHNE